MSTQQIDSHRFLTTEEVTSLFRIPVNTLYRWTCKGKGTGRVLPHVRIGRRMLFEREVIEAFINAHRVEGRGVPK